jgi:uncharacterized protein YjiS (DUF1127 family)
MSLISFSHGAAGARDRQAASSFSATLMSAFRTTFTGAMRRRQCRRDMLLVRDLPDHLLRDIGIQRGDIATAVMCGRERC